MRPVVNKVGLVALVGILIAACARSHDPPETWRMFDGRPMQTLLTDGEPTVALVIDPGQCLQCLGIIAEWLDWNRRNPDRLLLVLSREPDETEKRILLAAGVPFSGALSRGPSADSTPVELVFKDGKVIYMDAAIRRPTSPLLEGLETNSLAAFIASAGPEAQTLPDSRYPPP